MRCAHSQPIAQRAWQAHLHQPPNRTGRLQTDMLDVARPSDPPPAHSQRSVAMPAARLAGRGEKATNDRNALEHLKRRKRGPPNDLASGPRVRMASRRTRFPVVLRRSSRRDGRRGSRDGKEVETGGGRRDEPARGGSHPLPPTEPCGQPGGSEPITRRSGS
ncbi:hypothetical protein BDY21DRAFT_347061 [Lineolata rhizophorae]|uniref:Uncharacterized protein n=1 Tax=Lineolata rhizophorae TaxID=578093 RepID=A0A6A6NY80_9PEZI|nr:hypothetical protein BDY21DRAFT_347061 [Lineolata rhizophorae]